MTPPPLRIDTLADDLALLGDSARTFCQKAMPLSRLRPLRGSAAGFDRAVWMQMADLGWAGMSIPENVGGLGLNLSSIATVMADNAAIMRILLRSAPIQKL